MRILIDADACPSIKLIESTAMIHNIPIIIFCDNTHIIKTDYSEVVIVDKGYQNVDIVISNTIKKEDIVITQDYGLALIALSKSANAIHPKGMIYDEETLNVMLEERHLNTNLRRKGIYMKGPKKRTKTDDENLINNLVKIIK